MAKANFYYANKSTACIDSVECENPYNKPTFTNGEKWQIKSTGKVGEIGVDLFRSSSAARDGLILLLRAEILELQERITDLCIERALESIEDRVGELERR